MKPSLLAAKFLDLFRDKPGDMANLSVAGYAVPAGAAVVRCDLCKSVVMRDDFTAHCAYHATVLHASVQAVRDLVKS